MKGVSRIDSGGTHGWFVRVFRDTKVHSKMFSDGVNGGRDKALQAAMAYREEYVRQHPPDFAARRLKKRLQKNNKTGVSGVCETYGRSRSGEKMPCFGVTWNPEPGKPRCKKFHFSKYGDREAALEAATEFRKAREEEILQSVTGKRRAVTRRNGTSSDRRSKKG